MQENMWARLRDSRPGACMLDSRNLAYVFSCISVQNALVGYGTDRCTKTYFAIYQM